MFRKGVALLILAITLPFSIKSQCTTTVNSSDGYTVTINLTPTSIVAPGSCPFGYNFNIEFTYDIQFSGSNIPGSLYTLQGTFNCDNFSNIFYDLPNSGGSGTGTTTSNPYNPDSDCATATPSSLGCDDAVIEINGPGISSQQVNCAPSSLPISLLVFEGSVLPNNLILLRWVTESEINNDFFTIERSYDLKDWDIVKKISGAGNSNEILHYQTYDDSPISKITYYRLKQTDFDGSFEYSSAIALAPKKVNKEVNINYDNAKERYIISGPYEEFKLLRFFSIYGNEVEIPYTSQALDETNVKIEIHSLPSDIIIVKTRSNSLKLLSHK